MKKLLFIFVLAGLVFSTNACKKKESCPEPEVWGVGTWKAYKVLNNGTDVTNSGDTYVNCDLTDEIVLNESQNGTSWKFPYIDQNTNACSALNLSLTSWAESQSAKKLYVSFTYNNSPYTFDFDFINSSEFKKVWQLQNGPYEIYYKKQ